MTTTSNSANDCILSKPFVYFRRLSRGHSVKVSGSTSDISPLPNSNVPSTGVSKSRVWKLSFAHAQCDMALRGPSVFLHGLLNAV